MSSSNIRAARITRTNARVPSDNPSMLHRPRTVYVGKDQYPTSLVHLEDISELQLGKKQRGLDELEIVVCFLTRTHQISDLIELVYTEIPIDTHSAAQDSMKQMQRVLVSTYDINNLNASAFLTAAGNQVQLKS